MANRWKQLVAICSTVLRISTFIFLRWIPGHHFPRLILAALTVYLSTIYSKFDRFSSKAELRKSFPALIVQEEIKDLDSKEIQEIDIQVYYDEPVLYKDEHSFLKILLFGIPDWHESKLSFLTVAANLLCALLTLDLVFRGPMLHPGDDLRFSRTGFVDSVSARILVREADLKQLPIYTYFKSEDENQWHQAEKIWYMSSETDFTYPLLLQGLTPDTSYAYAISNNLNGTFQTAPAQESPLSNTLTFLTSSCIKANFPYNPFSHSLSIHGFSHLSKLIALLPSRPAFMLFLGDFIYVDVPQRLSSTISHYRSEYRRIYASPSWDLPGVKSIPWLHTLDDHEIANDWSGGNVTSPFPQASDPFIHYHVSVNPPIPLAALSGSQGNTTYFEFTRGPASFFLLDTRRYRTNPESNIPSSSSSKPLYASSDSSSNPLSSNVDHATILGHTQREHLIQFLSRPEPAGVHWKIIASSVPFTKNWRFGTADTWGGFLHERSIILDAMHRAEEGLGVRVVVLSGDRHEFAAIRFPRQLNPLSSSVADSRSTMAMYDTTPQSGPHEFSVGPLSMFYLPLRTFKQVDDQDVTLAYFPDGNSKIGVVEIGNMVGGGGGGGASTDFSNNRANRVSTPKGSYHSRANSGVVQQRSWLKYSLYIDAELRWEYMLMSPGL